MAVATKTSRARAARRVRLCALVCLMPAALVSCDLDLERVRVFVPFDAGPIDDEPNLCSVRVTLDLTDDGTVELERTYRFADDGTLRQLDESVPDDAIDPWTLDDPPLPYASTREIFFALDDTTHRHVVAKTRRRASTDALAHAARAGFVDGVLRHAELTGAIVGYGPRSDDEIPFVLLDANAVWGADEERVWRSFASEVSQRNIDSETRQPLLRVTEELTFDAPSSDVDATLTGTMQREMAHEGFLSRVDQAEFAVTFDDEGLPLACIVTDLQLAVPRPIRVDITRTSPLVVLTAREIEGPGIWTTRVERSARGHVHRVQRAGSLLDCRVALTDPLGTPVWLTREPAFCSPLVDEERGDTGFVERVQMGSRTARFTIENGCEDVCTLKEAAPLDEASVLALAARLFPVVEPMVFMRAIANTVVDNVPSCEVAP